MSIYDYFVQGLGLIATFFVIVAFMQKNDGRLKFIVMVGAAIFTVHFLLLGAYAGAIVGVINVTRTAMSMTRFKGNYILAIFIALYITTGIYAYENWYDILPFIAGAGSTIALFKLSGLNLRYAYFCTEISWLTYSVIIKSIGGIITNMFVLMMNAVTTYRLLNDRKKGVLS